MSEELKQKLTERFDFISSKADCDKDVRDALLKAYLAGAEYGYQYAVEKACQYFYNWNKKQVEKHGSKAVLGIREFTINVSDLRKAMEE